MKHRCMILIPTVKADAGQRGFGMFFREIHGKLPCLDNLAFAGLGMDHLNRDVEIIAYNLLYVINRDFP